ncbi:peptidoglycan/xylan/chitin deacetylase (PgdA/CDA1 family) [Caldicoprobacter guelmensis]|uniref:polysaccharide deacetylase family protein n=1 Tax=Caldicoprobacter guelmensis TaxID=1170224 RepID=UPI00195EB8EE|nr:polysaccharide deacetylase family protein [Caldicoprobacter guelmensis]MBM7582910.1 peptidoglycan/xylan/chitin deacetylase (PgdA/CDA1 family) [Caldicoprobacter guelmensis]
MRLTRKISTLIYIFIYFMLVQNMGAIIAGPNPVELKDIKPSEKSNWTYPISAPITLPPINMDENTRTRLKNFRDEAAKLCQLYPETFISSLPIREKKIALTFDDGPDSQTTTKVLDILQYHNIKATFFVIGQNVDKHREVIYRIIKSGHEIANHSWSHIRPTFISTEELINEIEKTCTKLQETGINTRVFRPPYGLVTPQQMEMLKALGYKAVIWSIDSMDWYTSDPQEIVQCVVKNAHPGAIILMHCAGGPNNRHATVEALPLIISALKKEGYEFATLGQLLYY